MPICRRFRATQVGPKILLPGADRFPRPSGVRDQPVRHKEQVHPSGGRVRLRTGVYVCTWTWVGAPLRSLRRPLDLATLAGIAAVLCCYSSGEEIMAGQPPRLTLVAS